MAEMLRPLAEAPEPGQGMSLYYLRCQHMSMQISDMAHGANICFVSVYVLCRPMGMEEMPGPLMQLYKKQAPVVLLFFNPLLLHAMQLTADICLVFLEAPLDPKPGSLPP
ncbi:hypothetical protein BTVI_124724 [Pitangus sulphuratus]|nr:hypothetical protein BTVI_124724 [Pitangus sulphuratus]